MAKTIIREIIIMLLLCLAIIVVLGLLLYDYVPMSKVVPEPVSYTTPENVKQELQASGEVDESQVIMTYEVDATDLKNYQNVKNYNPGKANPFSSYDPEGNKNTTTTTTTSGVGGTASSASSTTNNNQSQNNSNNTSNTTSNISETPSSGGQFFQDKGTK